MSSSKSKTIRKPKQFNFSRHWRQRLAPLLELPAVVEALDLGLSCYYPDYKHGDPPWLLGAIPLEHHKHYKGCLSWYQPLCRCHWIVPFCWALGRELYPDLKWGMIMGKWHSVAVGYRDDDWRNPVWVMDILRSQDSTAAESLEHALQEEPVICRSLGDYAGHLLLKGTGASSVEEAIEMVIQRAEELGIQTTKAA